MAKIHGAIQAQEEENLASINDINSLSKAYSSSLSKLPQKMHSLLI